VAVPDRAIVARAARIVGRRLWIVPVPAPPVRLALSALRRVTGAGIAPDVLEVLTTDTRVDPAPAAGALGITLTGLDDMIRHSLQP
jgi:hypothetical protein